METTTVFVVVLSLLLLSQAQPTSANTCYEDCTPKHQECLQSITTTKTSWVKVLSGICKINNNDCRSKCSAETRSNSRAEAISEEERSLNPELRLLAWLLED